MADTPQFGKGALILAMVGAGAAGVWFGRCSRNVPAEASSGAASAWAPASTAASPPAPASAQAAPSTSSEETPGKLEPQHFDVTANPKWTGGVPLRPIDKDIFKLLNDLEHMDRARMGDVFPDRPYRVRFIGSVEQRHVGIVMIDFKRTGAVDEKWDLGTTEVKRTVPKDPNGGDNEVRYTLAQGKWQVH